MTIPKIANYPLPLESEVPVGRANWQLQPHRAALLIHDMQQYFLEFFDRMESPAMPMLRNVAALRSRCKEAGVPVVYSAQPAVQSPPERGLLEEMWGPGITAYPEKSEIELAIGPESDDLVLTKWRYSAFSRTHLAEWMRESGRDQLIICGVYAHIGCQATAIDAFMLDIQPFVVADALADFSREQHVAALQYVASCCGVCLPLSAVEASLDERPASQRIPKREQSRLRAKLKEELARMLGLDVAEISNSQSLFEQGLDSMRLMMVTEFINEIGARATLVELGEEPTLNAWFSLLDGSVEHTA